MLEQFIADLVLLHYNPNRAPYWLIVWRFPWWVGARLAVLVLAFFVLLGWGPSAAGDVFRNTL